MSVVNNTFANALKGSTNGEVIAITDISPIEHDLSVKVSSKNLIPYGYSSKTEYGIQYTVNEDGTVICNGTSSGATFLFVQSDKKMLFPKGVYYWSCLTQTQDGVSAWARSQTTTYQDTGKGVIVNLEEDTELYFYVTIRSGTVIDNLVLKPMFTKGTTATDYVPYVDDIDAVKVKAQGKNLISSDLWNDKFEKQEDGSYKSITNIAQGANIKELNLPAQVYSFSYSLKSPVGKNYRLQIIYTDETVGDSGASVSSTNEYIAYRYKTNGKAIKSIRWGYSAQSNEVQFKDLQLEVGSFATEYEPYIRPVEYEAGAVEGIKSIYPSATLSTDTIGAVIECEYNRDLNKAFAEMVQAIISLGGNI